MRDVRDLLSLQLFINLRANMENCKTVSIGSEEGVEGIVCD